MSVCEKGGGGGGKGGEPQLLCVYVYINWWHRFDCWDFEQAARYWKNLAKSSKGQKLSKRGSDGDLSGNFVSPDDILSVIRRRKAGRTSGSLVLHVESDVSLENLGKKDSSDRKSTGMPCRSISSLT